MTKRNSSLKWFYLKSTTDSLNSLALKQINNLAVIKHTISNLRKSICQSSQKKTDSSFSHTILLLYPDRRYAFIIFNPFKIPSNIFSTLSIRNLAAIISHTHIDSSTESHQKLATIPNSQRAPENRFSSGDPAIYSWTRYRGCTGPGGRAMTLNFQEKGGGGSPCISRSAAPTLHRALFNGRFFALFGRLINHGGSRLYFAPVFRCNREPAASPLYQGGYSRVVA